MRIGFVLLAHEKASALIPLIEALIGADAGDYVVVHYDASCPKGEFVRLQEAFHNSDQVRFVTERVKCGWGEFGLVEGVVRALQLMRAQHLPVDRVYLLSGSCMPVRPINELRRYLNSHPSTEFIENHTSDWIVGGLRDERFLYRHWLNERKHPWLFYRNVDLQRFLGLKQKFPSMLEPRFGSQWWCLTWETCNKILSFIDDNPSSFDFFRTTWIPDELFFQSLVFYLAPDNIANISLTYFRFTNQGKPVVLYDDHIDIARNLPFFFARKIGPGAAKLRAALLARAVAPDSGEDMPVLGDPNHDLDLPRVVRQQVGNPRPGQLFYGDQIIGQWHSTLRAARKNFVVLYGPSAITDVVRDALKTHREFDAFGRLFARDKIDFGDGRTSFKGLSSDDIKVRDIDPINYLCRVLNRTQGVPVFQIVPGDNPSIESFLAEVESALVILFHPKGAISAEEEPSHTLKEWLMERRSRDWRILNSAIVAREVMPAIERSFVLPPDGSTDEVVLSQLGEFIPHALGHWHLGALAEGNITSSNPKGLIRLPWGIDGQHDDAELEEGDIDALSSSFLAAPASRHLIDTLISCQSLLASIQVEKIQAALPASWQPYFASILKPISHLPPQGRPARGSDKQPLA